MRVQKLEREEERKKKIAEKLAAGKNVGQNKKEKGKTAYIEHYIGPNGEIDWNKSNVEKPIDYSKPTKVSLKVFGNSNVEYNFKKPKKPTPVKTTADPYAPDDDENDEEHDDDGPSIPYAPPAKKPKKPSKKPSKKPYAPEPEPTTPEPTTAEPTTTTEEVTTEAITTKPKKNPYAPEPTKTPDYETTTTVEPTTTSKLRSTWRPDLTTTTEKPSKNSYAPPEDNDNGYGDDGDDMDNVYAPDSEVKGDPHFMVRSPGQEAVCFDADAPPGEEIPLVFDPVIGLSISGTIEHREALNRTVIDTMHILTPGGVSVHISHEGLIVDGYRNPFKKIHPKVIWMTPC